MSKTVNLIKVAMELFISENQKTYKCFNLPAGPIERGGSCAGCTDYCWEKCYTHTIRMKGKAPAARYRANLKIVQELEGRPGDFATIFEAKIQDTWPCFRWHSSGDIVSAGHLEGMSLTAEAKPGMPTWAYTRSFNEVREALENGIRLPDNLRLFASADPENVDEAEGFAKEFGFDVAYMGKEFGRSRGCKSVCKATDGWHLPGKAMDKCACLLCKKCWPIARGGKKGDQAFALHGPKVTKEERGK